MRHDPGCEGRRRGPSRGRNTSSTYRPRPVRIRGSSPCATRWCRRRALRPPRFDPASHSSVPSPTVAFLSTSGRPKGSQFTTARTTGCRAPRGAPGAQVAQVDIRTAGVGRAPVRRPTTPTSGPRGHRHNPTHLASLDARSPAFDVAHRGFRRTPPPSGCFQPNRVRRCVHSARIRFPQPGFDAAIRPSRFDSCRHFWRGPARRPRSTGLWRR